MVPPHQARGCGQRAELVQVAHGADAALGQEPAQPVVEHVAGAEAKVFREVIHDLRPFPEVAPQPAIVDEHLHEVAGVLVPIHKVPQVLRGQLLQQPGGFGRLHGAGRGHEQGVDGASRGPAQLQEADAQLFEYVYVAYQRDAQHPAPFHHQVYVLMTSGINNVTHLPTARTSSSARHRGPSRFHVWPRSGIIS
jgi:hypothetical protein